MKWQKFTAALLLIELVACLLLGSVFGFRYPIPVLTYLVVSAVFCVCFTYAAAVFFLLVRRSPMPWRWIFETCTAFTLIAVQIAVLAWSKGTMPHVVGFWADPFLADLDAFLFGADPWIALHRNLAFTAPFVDSLYVTWAPLKFSILLVLVLLPQNEARSRLLCAYFLIVSVVAAFQYLLPSAGPIFYERIGLGDRFADLPVAPWVKTASDYLWLDYLGQSGRLGGGISAMPSLHVAVSAWFVLVSRSQLPYLLPFALAYFLTIVFGSVFLGWHYATDAVVGVAIVYAVWKATGLYKFTEQRETPTEGTVQTEPETSVAKSPVDL
ncbi:phosphatase PAP2 family protein [Qipengyuania aquimaris]|uniref:phosphatase PAP2 family protein n=1 Tax=Qipengyuania aquimaris TaxID=255984 RepID=UPI001FD3EA1A|nr:phosphatase PAP2 family protein [Qipengyuania aquimaris]UOR15129.1 phosphatase PAP2 family protein [Qipengyuania aquimaris]